MDRPASLDRCLIILVLRSVGCSQDDVAYTTHWNKSTVGEVERWFKSLSWEEASRLCDDQAIKRIVGRELVSLEEVAHETLVKAAQLSGDDILRHYRQDYLGMKAEYEEQRRFLPLLEQWQEQIQFLSVDQLLRKHYLENWRTELEHELTEHEEVSQAYLDAYGQHWRTMPRPYKVMLPIESDSSFQELKQLYPDAKIWQAQGSWGEAYGIYLDAFVSWVTEVKYISELLMEPAKNERASEDFHSDVANAWQLLNEAERAKLNVWLFIRLLALTVACDLLVLGIEQLSPNAIWAVEVAKIRKLRQDIVLTSMKELCSDFWLTGTNRVYPIAKSLWDKHEPVKEKTTALVKALERLQIAQNDVYAELKALEQTLSDHVHASPSRGSET